MSNHQAGGPAGRARRGGLVLVRLLRTFFWSFMGALSANTNKVNAPLIPPDTRRVEQRDPWRP